MTETESESAALRDARIAELERELAKQLERNKLLKHANSLFANSGDNDELAIDKLRRELDEAHAAIRTCINIALGRGSDPWSRMSLAIESLIDFLESTVD